MNNVHRTTVSNVKNYDEINNSYEQRAVDTQMEIFN